jgi:hypothetical protein
MTPPPLPPRQIFAGTAEIERAVTVVGWVAITHARVEEALDYLLWQLEAFDRAGRRSHKRLPPHELQNMLRALRQEVSGGLIKHRVAMVTECFTRQRIAKRLGELENGIRFPTTWQTLATRIVDLSVRRNEVIHSAIGWSAGEVVRTIGGPLDGTTLSVDLARDWQLATDLGNLATEIGQFSTDLGFNLPFAGDDKIVVATTVAI